LDKQKARSQTRYGEPVWDETLNFLVETKRGDSKSKPVSPLHAKLVPQDAPNELSTLNYDQYAYIEVFDHDYLSPNFIGSAVIPSITKWTDEEELIIDLTRGGVKTASSITVKVQCAYFSRLIMSTSDSNA
jgi:hypothetical protein